MKTRSILVLAVILVLVLAGSASVAADGAEVPFYTRLDVHPQFAGPITEPPYGFKLAVPGEGQALHLGECTWNALMRVYSNQTQDGDMVFTAANGDELRGNFVGTGIPDANGVSHFQGTFELRGGTGRFEYASGAGAYWGTAVLGEGVLYFEGTLIK